MQILRVFLIAICCTFAPSYPRQAICGICERTSERLFLYRQRALNYGLAGLSGCSGNTALLHITMVDGGGDVIVLYIHIISKLFYVMKKTYTGLIIRRITVECQPLMQNSNQKMKAKTKVEDWGTHEESYEMGIDFELHELSSSETPPVMSGPTP